MFPEHKNCIQLPNISNWDEYSLMESYLFKFITTVYKKIFLCQNVWNKFASPVALYNTTPKDTWEWLWA